MNVQLVDEANAFLDALPKDPVSKETVALKEFFERGGIDFENHPKSRIVADCSQLLFRLPPSDMARVKAILANYSEVKQSHTTVRAEYTNGNVDQSVSVSLLCLSGKRASFYGINPCLFGFPRSEGERSPGIEISATTNTDNNDSIDVIMEWRANVMFGGADAEVSAELSLMSGERYPLASRIREEGGQVDNWNLQASVEVLEWDAVIQEETTTDFIPISRRAIEMIFNGEIADSYANPFDPFASADDSIQTAKEIGLSLANFYNEGSIPESPDGTSIGFDGEQIIITHTSEVIQHIKETVMKLDYIPPIIGRYNISYINERGVEVSEIVALSGLSGKRGTFEVSRYEMYKGDLARVDGVELIMTPLVHWDAHRIEGCISEFRLVTDGSSPAWYMELESDSDGQKWTQSLPPISESDWSLQYSEKAKD